MVDTVEVNTRCLVPKLVVDVDDDGVARRRPNLWAWPLIVDTNQRPADTGWRSPNPCDIPVILNRRCFGISRQRQERQGRDS